MPLGRVVSAIRNGHDVTQASYEDDDADAIARYLSVASVSSGVLITNETKPLGATAEVRDLLEAKLGIRSGDLVLTRSGTPGIPWPFVGNHSHPLIAAGFMMQIRCQNIDEALYLAAILNHPAWRVRSRAHSAGKRQDNIDQVAVSAIPIPWPVKEARSRIAEAYRGTMLRIQNSFEDAQNFEAECNEVLAKWLGFPPLSVQHGLWHRQVSLDDIANSGLRFDGRWHAPRHLTIRGAVGNPVRLGTLLSSRPVRGKQPKADHSLDAADDQPLCITTACIQQGQVVWDDLQPTAQSPRSIRRVREHQLIVAMDGVGSLGKAAVFRSGDQSRAIGIDSHLSTCDFASQELADAIACFLNSTWGRAQTEGLMTGATGQTQLSADDLERVLVPRAIANNAEAISNSYQAVLTVWRPPKIAAREIICEGGAATTQQLVEAGALKESAFLNHTELRSLLNLLY